MLWKNKVFDFGTVQKSWGNIRTFSSPWGAAGKILNIKAGKSTSFKYYDIKNELMFCLSGSVLVYSPNSDEFTEIKNNENKTIIKLCEGESICIERNTPYKIVAIEDSQLVEVVSGIRRGFDEPIKYDKE